MRVLVACEFSGIVRDAFTARGHHAVSCDLIPSERPGLHYTGDVLYLLENSNWDLLIAHPPCTYLCNSGAKHFYLGMKKENGPNPERWSAMRKAARFFKALLDAPVERKCIENPIMIGYAKKIIGVEQSQIIQPHMFGHGEIKATCLWLMNLPTLEPTNLVLGRTARVHRESPSPDRWKNRSRTLQGIADAMADQWGNL